MFQKRYLKKQQKATVTNSRFIQFILFWFGQNNEYNQSFNIVDIVAIWSIS